MKLVYATDFDAMWNKWLTTDEGKAWKTNYDKDPSKVTKFTLAIESGDFEVLEKKDDKGNDNTLVLPAILCNMKELNVSFTSSFAKVNAKGKLEIDVQTNGAFGDESSTNRFYTITLPDANKEFNLTLKTAKQFVTLTSAGASTLSRLEYDGQGGQTVALNLKNTTVNVYEILNTDSYIKVADGASIVALVANANGVTSEVNSQKASSEVRAAYITSPYINGSMYSIQNARIEGTSNVDVKMHKNTPINKITIASKATIILHQASVDNGNDDTNPYVNEIVGEGDATKYDATVFLDAWVNGSLKQDNVATGLKNIAKLNNVYVRPNNGSTVNVYAKNEFTKTLIQGTIKPQTEEVTTLSGVIVQNKVSLEIPSAEFTFTFDGIEFNEGATAVVDKATFLKPIMKDGKPVVEENYWYAIDLTQPVDFNKPEGKIADGGGNYKVVHYAEDIPADNKKADSTSGTQWGQWEDTPLFENLKSVDLELIFNGGKYNGKDMASRYVEVFANPTNGPDATARTAAAQAIITIGSNSYKWYDTYTENESQYRYILVDKD